MNMQENEMFFLRLIDKNRLAKPMEDQTAS
jgi:hypothetical protein